MAELVILIKKKTDGSAALSCRRADGSVTSVVTDEELNRVRDRRRELFARWAALPAGESWELPFP